MYNGPSTDGNARLLVNIAVNVDMAHDLGSAMAGSEYLTELTTADGTNISAPATRTMTRRPDLDGQEPRINGSLALTSLWDGN